MPAAQYRLFMSNNPATQAQLDTVESITVEQEVDLVWEARLQVLLRVDEKGKWQGEGEVFMRPFARVRIEIKLGDGGFIPLIDGPVVGNNSFRSGQPGESYIEVVVRDDSVYLNRHQEVEPLENMSDHEIAAHLFQSISQIAQTDIDPTPPPPVDSVPPMAIRRGTPMHMLRTLARTQGMHVYVLPGDQPGRSVGCFKRFSTRPSNLPPLILLGPDRNVVYVTVSGDAESPATAQAFSLSVTDRTVTSAQSSFNDVELLGENQAFASESDTGTQLAPPGPSSRVDTRRRAEALTEQASFMLEARGTVLSDCYDGVLRPYQVVNVRAINDTLSGNYLIHQVTHVLTRSAYSQSFVMKRNALSGGAGSGLASLIGSIF